MHLRGVAMHFKSAIAGVAVGSLLTAIAALVIASRAIDANAPDEQPLMLPHFDASIVGNSAFAEGSLSGPGVDHANNYFRAQCLEADGFCTIVRFEDVSEQPIEFGRLIAHVTIERWPIRNWAANLVVAQTDPATECYRETITIRLPERTAQYTRAPNPDPTKAGCRELPAVTQMLREPPGWGQQTRRSARRRPAP